MEAGRLHTAGFRLSFVGMAWGLSVLVIAFGLLSLLLVVRCSTQPLGDAFLLMATVGYHDCGDLGMLAPAVKSIVIAGQLSLVVAVGWAVVAAVQTVIRLARGAKR